MNIPMLSAKEILDYICVPEGEASVRSRPVDLVVPTDELIGSLWLEHQTILTIRKGVLYYV